MPKPPAPPAIGSAPPAPPAPAVPEGLRDITDTAATRTAIFDNVLKAASSLEPISNTRHTLALTDVHYADEDRSDSYEAQKKAILRGQSLGRRLRGTWVLTDNATGQVVDQRRQLLARVPAMTPRGTFIYRGNEYVLRNQQRLRPGVFVRRKANDELEAHANVTPGKGFSHHYMLDPQKSVFFLRLGHGRVPMLTLLRALGADDKEIRNQWGPDIYAANYAADDGSQLSKLYERTMRKSPRDVSRLQQQAELKEFFEKMSFDPQVTKRTLGGEHAKVDAAALLSLSKKLLAVHKGEADVDDRDALPFQMLLGPEDLFSERIARDAGAARKQLLWKSSFKNSLKSVPAGALESQLMGALLSSGLGMPLEEVNAGEIFDKLSQVSRMGVGGIPCYSDDTEVLTAAGWKAWPDVVAEDCLACLIDGSMQFRKPSRLYRAWYAGLLYRGQTSRLDYLVTPEHRLWLRRHTTISGQQGYADWEFRTAEAAHGKRAKHRVASVQPSAGADLPDFAIPPGPRDTANRGSGICEPVVVPFTAWVEFLAAYLADGSFSYGRKRGKSQYRVEIGKVLKANPTEVHEICQILEKLPFRWKYDGKRRFVLNGKHLAAYVRQFGKSQSKFVPDYVLQAAPETRLRFLELITTFDCSGRGERSRKFASASKQLRDQVALLALLQGWSVVYSEHTKAGEQPQYKVRIREVVEEGIAKQKQGDQFERVGYAGYVYCASVPNELLFVRRNGKPFWCGNSSDAIPQEARNVSPSQLNFIDPVRTPESEYAGVDTNLAGNIRKGPNGMMYAQYLDPRTGQLVWKSPQDVADLRVAFSPNSLQGGKHIPVMVGGRIRRIRRRDADLVVPSFERAFSGLANLVPMKNGMAPQRMSMAARMITQALPLVGAQAPYVRTEVPGQRGRSFEEEFSSRFGAIRTDQPAIVQAVNPGEIVLRTADGKTVRKELAVHLPMNRKTGLHHTPVVQVGQQIPAGGMLARSNYTDDQGAAALGLNVRVGYLPYKGMNYEDAVVVSESLAKRLTSDHLYQHSLDMADDKTHFGKSKFMSIFAGKHSRKTLENFDKDGLIKPGTEVQHGDPLILAARERDTPLNKVHRRGTPSFSDASETWKHRDPGIVTDSMMTANGPVVVVKSRQSLQVADKLSGRYGNKGVVAAVIPDAKMPQDAEGQPLELILNPLGVISRGNPAQLIESALGKIAAKTGKPYTVPGFDDGGAQKLLKFAEDELARHGMSDTEDLLDPETERKIPGVFVGNTFIMKLHHQAEGKEQGRSTGAYSMDDAPAKGGEHGAKRIGLLDTNAIISHNAPAVLRDARSIRGQRNDDYWMQYLQGHTPTSTKPSIAYEKYLNQLRAGGLHIQADGPRLHIMALTQKDVDELAGDRELENADTVKGDEMLPIKGGLFDEALTGGHRGTKWAKITLPEPFPSPVMEEPIRRLLGLTQKNFEAVLAGKESIHTGTGPAAIQKALAAINVPRELAITRQAIQTGSRSARDEAVRKLGYLKSAQRLNIHPKDWMLNSVPVLPPRFRPVSQLGASGMTLVSDPNYLYRELLQAKNNLRSLQGRVEDAELGDERLAVYNAFKAVTGLGDPTHPKLVEKGVKGALASVFGSSPKYSTVQRKLIGSTVDNVGRGVIAPNPDFDMDTIGLPEEAAWNVYQKHILRALRRRGLPLGNAIEQWQNRSGLAREVLVEQLDSRPIYANRAPVLHKFGFMAFRPRLVQGSAIQISPLVTKGFGADFDGDTMQFHVPQDDEAAKEAAERMLPSRSLLSPADFKSPMYAPSQEYAAGLWESTREPDSKARTRYFASRKDAVAAYERGDIGVRTPVVILDED